MTHYACCGIIFVMDTIVDFSHERKTTVETGKRRTKLPNPRDLLTTAVCRPPKFEYQR